MELYKTLGELSDKVSKLRNHVATEEATKTAFVLPFLVSLGYDIYNPLEVIPEMDCDISRKGDKVDYAINIDSKPAMIAKFTICAVDGSFSKLTCWSSTCTLTSTVVSNVGVCPGT